MVDKEKVNKDIIFKLDEVVQKVGKTEEEVRELYPVVDKMSVDASSVMLDELYPLCRYLNCRLEELVEIKFEEE